MDQRSPRQKHVLTDSKWVEAAFIIEAIVSLGPLFAVWGMGVAASISTLGSYYHEMLWHHIGFWSVILGGGYGLFSALFLGCWLNDYAHSKIPTWIRIGLAVGMFMFAYWLVAVSQKDSYLMLVGIIIPSPWTFTMTCLWRIHRFRRISKEEGAQTSTLPPSNC